jgi:hypothetical protein
VSTALARLVVIPDLAPNASGGPQSSEPARSLSTVTTEDEIPQRLRVVDAWSVTVYTTAPLTAAAADELRRRVERELAEAARRLSDALGPDFRVQAEG